MHLRLHPLEQPDLEAAIARVTRALATDDDDSIPELVAERAALRTELRDLQERDAGVARLGDERARGALEGDPEGALRPAEDIPSF